MRGKTKSIKDITSAFPYSHTQVDAKTGDATVTTAPGLSQRLLLAGLVAGQMAGLSFDDEFVAAHALRVADRLIKLASEEEDTCDLERLSDDSW